MPSRFHEILRFLLVGGGCFLLDYGLLYVLTEYAGLYYLLSSGISFSVSVFVNYRLCLIYVFHGASAEEECHSEQKNSGRLEHPKTLLYHR